MKNDCNVITDLMPLCAEGIASDDSVRLVEEHIAQCGECKAAFDGMKAASGSPASEDAVAPLKAVKRKLKLGRARIAGIFALAVLLAVLCVFSAFTAREYIPFSDGLITVEEQADGSLRAEINGADDFTLTYFSGDYDAENTQPDSVYIEAWNTPIGNLHGEVSAYVVDLGKVDRVEYCDVTQDGQLCYVYGEERNGGVIVLERLTLSYWFILSVLGTLVLGVLWLIFRKRAAGRTISYIFFAPVSYLLGHLIVMGVDPQTWSADRSFGFIFLSAAVIYAMIALVRAGIKEQSALK